MKPYELELEIRKIGEEHPSAEVLILAPTGDSWNYCNQLLKVRGVNYEPKVAFYNGQTYFDEEDLYNDYPELEGSRSETVYFNEYIIIDCME